jgi:hypothetical protein
MRGLLGRVAQLVTALVCVGGSGCAGHGTSAVSAANGRGGPVYRYEVTAGPGGHDLSVVATFPKGSDSRLTVIDRADTFLVGVELEGKKGWAEIRREGSLWVVPECSSGCRLRYRYLLADAAGTWGDLALARREAGAIESPPSTWLLRPEHAPPGTRLRFHVTTAPSDMFVTGVFPASDAPAPTPSSGTYEAQATDFMQLPYSAFGVFRLHEIDGGNATLALLPGALAEDDTVAWATASLSAVRGFYGRPTVPHVLILARTSTGDEVGFGMTMGFSGAAIAINVGSETRRDGFRRDWVLVHELVHTALPDLPQEQHWLEEGLATYVEPLARYRQGALTAEDVWGEWALRMKQGEPEPGDEGLDNTHTWARTYWGGALFCLQADLEIRTRTAGKASLEDALRGILGAGGSIAVSWPIERVLDVGDRATGTTVLRETYEKMAKHPTPVDLPTVWRRLGISLDENEHAHFDDKAELAWVRRAMTPAR